MKKILILLILLSSMSLAFSQTYVELVLDASGSMWNKLDDGRFRITAAKEVLSDFIGGLPDGDLNIGLRIYGSLVSALDAGACDDTKLFVDLAGMDKSELINTVNVAKAIGATPIAKSLLAAADDFPNQADRRMIILVTDGEESCGGDLQAVAADLKSRGFDIDIRIIGFDLDQKAIDSFKGIGKFENAANAEELGKALKDAVDEVIETAIVPVEYRFDNNDEAWLVFGDAQGDSSKNAIVPADYNPEGYICAEDSAAGGIWYWLAPLHGDASKAYGMTLSFDEKQSQTDRQFDSTDIIIESENIALSFSTNKHPDTEFTSYQVLLTEAGWQNETSGQAATKDDFLAVLGNLKMFRLRGEYRDGADTGCLDNVVIGDAPRAARGQINLLAPDSTPAGKAFNVAYSGDIRVSEDDFIVLVNPENKKGSYHNRAYVKEDNSPVSITAPIKPGIYEIRYLDHSDDSILATRAITVTESKITLSAPETVSPGQSFEVTWVGPDGEGDYITLVSKETEDGKYDEWYYTKDGNPLSFTAPIISGDYEIRYQSDREDGVFARKALNIGEAEFSFSAPATVEAGTSFEVGWTGPDGPQDYITIVAVGSKPGAYKSYEYTSNGSPVTLMAETVAGEYEIRYQSDRESGIIFASTPITVTPMQISIQAPSQVNAGESFEVSWTGPDGPDDYITIVPAGAEAGAYEDYKYTTNGSPLSLTAPTTPGNYEIRYQSDRVSGITFASIPIVVK